MSIIRLLFITFCLVVVYGQFDDDFPEQQLLSDIFDVYSYYKDARPVVNYRKAVTVHHSLTLVRIHNVDDNHFVADTWQAMTWRDRRLEWNRGEHDGIDKVNIEDSRIWLPDILLYNNAAEGSGKTYKSIRVVVDHQGLVQYVPPTRVSAYCKDVEVQDNNSKVGDKQCQLKFGSWTYTSDKLNLVIDREGLILSDYEENPKYKIVYTDVSQQEERFGCCSDSYTTIIYTIILRPKFTGPLRDEPGADSETLTDEEEEKKDVSDSKETNGNENNEEMDETETDGETDDQGEENAIDDKTMEGDGNEDANGTYVVDDDEQFDNISDINNVDDQTDNDDIDGNIDDNVDDNLNDDVDDNSDNDEDTQEEDESEQQDDGNVDTDTDSSDSQHTSITDEDPYKEHRPLSA